MGKGNNGVFSFVVWVKESSVGFCKAGPFEDSTAYDETCGVPDTHCLLVETICCGWLGKKPHYAGRETPFYFPSLPHASLLNAHAEVQPAGTPHAIVACITPGSYHMYSITFSCHV